MRIFCSTCGHETEFTHHCSEHNGYEEAKRANAETESWKRRWASTQTKLNDLIEFYGNEKNYLADEADVILVHYDRGTKARDIKNERNQDNGV